MLSPTTVGLFALASVVLAITSGPDMLYILTRAFAQGRGAGVVSTLGVHTGVLVHTLIAALGLSALIAASAVAFSVVKYAGAIYLGYLGARTLLSRAETLELKTAQPARLRRVYFQGLITNLLNPKVILFFLAFLPQFIGPARERASVQLLLLGGVLGTWFQRRKGAQTTSKWVTVSVFIALGLGTAFYGGKRA